MRLLSLVAPAALVAGHMQMLDPAPFRSKHNSFSSDIDYSMTSPLGVSGSDFPCKGYHALLDTPQGQSVATWQAGRSYSMSLEGSATHAGGSCQLSLSYDKGHSWTVLHSFIGACPLTPRWEFALPADAPAGEALFAWSWFNRLGNREMYMNCAHVTIQAAAAAQNDSDAWASRPAMFAANVGNGCRTLEGSDVLFPEPGPNVNIVSDKMAAPVGECSRPG
ncbi:hypothetical protein E4U41_003808 [Claviceps citrina]|nr:hypothetical protein E4U41_003808 [Claviceps citrina]